MTAAHCVKPPGGGKWKNIKVSLHDPVSNQDTTFEVSNHIVHPQYSGPFQIPPINDLAILKLSTPVQDAKDFVCLPNNAEDQLIGANVTITGWGLTEVRVDGVKPKPSDVLKSAFTIVITNSVCTEYFDRKMNEFLQKIIPGSPHLPITVPDEIICADGQSTNSIACKGDSGGKLEI